MIKNDNLSLSRLKTAPTANTLLFANSQLDDGIIPAGFQRMIELVNPNATWSSSASQFPKDQIFQINDEAGQKLLYIEEPASLREKSLGVAHGN